MSLAQAAVRKGIVKTTTDDRSVEVLYYNQLRVTYKISVPNKFSSGKLLTASFTDNGKDIGSVSLYVSVSDAAPTTP